MTLGEAGSGIALGGTVAGLEASATGGIHVHTGVSCASADVVGGHYFDGMDADPWLTTTYASNEAGVAAVAVTVAGFSPEDVIGRAVVVHDGDGARVACGLLEATTTDAATAAADADDDGGPFYAQTLFWSGFALGLLIALIFALGGWLRVYAAGDQRERKETVTVQMTNPMGRTGEP